MLIDSFLFFNETELTELRIKYLNKIVKKINQFDGCMLTFDYGYVRKANHDTLQAVQKHGYVDPLVNAGSSDISSHVNFKLLTEILRKNKNT